MKLSDWKVFESRRTGLTIPQIEYKMRYTMDYDGLIIRRKGRFKYVIGFEYKSK